MSPSPPSRPDLLTIAIGGVGVLITALALGLMATPSSAFLAPFASTAAIKYAAPDNPIAQPRSVVGGHMLGVLAGVGVGAILPGPIVGPAIAAALSVGLMIPTSTMHPPAAAVAVIAQQHAGHPWDSIAAVVVALAVSTACAVVLYRVLHRQAYPAPGWSEGLLPRRAAAGEN